MSNDYMRSLSSSLQRKDWNAIEKHFLPSNLPASLARQIQISNDIELTVPGQLKFSIEGLNWPNKFFGECLIHLLALKKGIIENLSFPTKMGLIAKLLNSLGRPDVLGILKKMNIMSSFNYWMRS
jgi:hypothetical protein